MRLLRNSSYKCHVECDEMMETRDRFAFSGRAVHPRCALITAEGAGDADRVGVVVVGEVGRPRRGAVHMMDFLQRRDMRIDSAVSRCGGQQFRIARLMGGRAVWDRRRRESNGIEIGDSEVDRQ